MTGELRGTVASARTDRDNDAWERSARFWLRAYPRRWRAERGEELLGVLADLAEPDARRLGRRTAADLLRSGWATRLREHPPLGPWLLYRTLDLQIPVRWREWAADDIAGFWFPARRQGVLWFLLVIGLVQRWWLDGGPFSALFPVVFAVSVVLAMTVTRARVLSMARQRHLLAVAGEPLREGLYLYQDVPRPRLDARQGTGRFVLVLAAVAALCVPAALRAPLAVFQVPIPGEPGSFEIVVGPIGSMRTVVVVLLLLGAVAGTGVLVVVRGRLRRLLRPGYDQPHRSPVTSTRRLDAVLALLVAVVAVAAWSEGSGQTAVGFSVALGAAALLMLPGAIVALAAARGLPRGPVGPEGATAFVDLWHVATAGHQPPTDTPRHVVVPAVGPFPAGAVVAARPIDGPTGPVTA